MIQSMTGYGKAIAEIPNKKITVEIRSLNSKQFDLFTRIPSAYKEKEISVRNALSRALERGKIDLFFSIEVINKDITSKIDHRVISQYCTEIREISGELGIPEPQEWYPVLLRLPDVMKQETEELDDEEWKVIEKAITDAMISVIAFRSREGLMLEKILREKVQNIRQLLQEVESYETERIEKVRMRIYEGLNTLDSIEYDKNRFEQEMIYYIEKLDINEEKNRLAHHLDYFTETINEKRSQGKKLGFIVQEIGREINTLGSKSNQSEMQRIVVQMKDELEQMKEQILNVL